MIANGKFLQLISIFLHRQHQIATAKDNINFYASLHHIRNTKNRGQPFHKTFNLLSRFLIKEADNAALTTATDAASAAAVAAAGTGTRTGLAIDTTIDNVATDGSIQSASRVVRFNLRFSFQEVYNYATITSGTPGKGRAVNP